MTRPILFINHTASSGPRRGVATAAALATRGMRFASAAGGVIEVVARRGSGTRLKGEGRFVIERVTIIMGGALHIIEAIGVLPVLAGGGAGVDVG